MTTSRPAVLFDIDGTLVDDDVYLRYARRREARR